MNLARDAFVSGGIFGTLQVNEALKLYTLEHAYAVAPDGDSLSTTWAPKIPPGTYTCIRGTHFLGSGPSFVTFEITGVAGHTGLLFHPGNVNADSEGCVLLGLGRLVTTEITQSRLAFSAFMESLEGLDIFNLTVS